MGYQKPLQQVRPHGTRLPEFTYLAPTSEEELWAMLQEQPDTTRILAGGTDLVVQMKDRAQVPTRVVDIKNIRSLRVIEPTDQGGAFIGATARLAEVERHPAICEQYTALVQALRTIGSSQVRAMGTLGGNSCNASPAADSPPALIVLGAVALIGSAKGERELELDRFFVHNGKTALSPTEYLRGFRLPKRAPNSASHFCQLGLRLAMECDTVNAAAFLQLDDRKTSVTDAAICLGAVAPTPLLLQEAKKSLVGQPASDELWHKAAQVAQKEASPINDFRASAAYRRHLVQVLTQRVLAGAYAEIKGTQP